MFLLYFVHFRMRYSFSPFLVLFFYLFSFRHFSNLFLSCHPSYCTTPLLLITIIFAFKCFKILFVSNLRTYCSQKGHWKVITNYTETTRQLPLHYLLQDFLVTFNTVTSDDVSVYFSYFYIVSEDRQPYNPTTLKKKNFQCTSFPKA